MAYLDAHRLVLEELADDPPWRAWVLSAGVTSIRFQIDCLDVSRAAWARKGGEQLSVRLARLASSVPDDHLGAAAAVLEDFASLVNHVCARYAAAMPPPLPTVEWVVSQLVTLEEKRSAQRRAAYDLVCGLQDRLHPESFGVLTGLLHDSSAGRARCDVRLIMLAAIERENVPLSAEEANRFVDIYPGDDADETARSARILASAVARS